MACVRCKENESMNVMLPIAEVTEVGRIIFPNETENQSVQVPVELCFKCMAFASEGWINVVKVPNQDKFTLLQVSDKDSEFCLEFFEDRYKQGELTKDIEESLLKFNTTRSKVKKQKLKNTPLRIAVIVEEVFNQYAKSQSKDLKDGNQVKEKENGNGN